MGLFQKVILKLAQKFVLVNCAIKPGDLIEHCDDRDFTAESLGVYYSAELKPFLFFRTPNGLISARPPNEFRRCSDVDRITEGML